RIVAVAMRKMVAKNPELRRQRVRPVVADQLRPDWLEARVGVERRVNLRWQLVQQRGESSVERIGPPLTPAFTKKPDMLAGDSRAANCVDDRVPSSLELQLLLSVDR